MDFKLIFLSLKIFPFFYHLIKLIKLNLLIILFVMSLKSPKITNLFKL